MIWISKRWDADWVSSSWYGKNGGYVQWAKKYNVKQFAESILFLQQHDIHDKETLDALVDGSSAKYHELISSFDDFDTSNLPAVLNNDVNFYQMGWAGATTLASVSLFEVVDKLNIEFELQYNVPALKRNGIEVNSLPPIHKKKTWTYSNSLDQAEIYNSVAKEIEYLCSL